MEDVKKSIMDAYEARYNEIVKAHENRCREVAYGLYGEKVADTDEIGWLAMRLFKMALANLEGYIACQQTKTNFLENPDSSCYFNRNAFQNEGKTQDRNRKVFIGIP